MSKCRDYSSHTTAVLDYSSRGELWEIIEDRSPCLPKMERAKERGEKGEERRPNRRKKKSATQSSVGRNSSCVVPQASCRQLMTKSRGRSESIRELACRSFFVDVRCAGKNIRARGNVISRRERIKIASCIPRVPLAQDTYGAREKRGTKGRAETRGGEKFATAVSHNVAGPVA